MSRRSPQGAPPRGQQHRCRGTEPWSPHIRVRYAGPSQTPRNSQRTGGQCRNGPRPAPACAPRAIRTTRTDSCAAAQVRRDDGPSPNPPRNDSATPAGSAATVPNPAPACEARQLIRTTRAPIPAPPRRCGATTDQARIHPGTIARPAGSTATVRADARLRGTAAIRATRARLLLRHADSARRANQHPNPTPEPVGRTSRQCRNGPRSRTGLRGAAPIQAARAPIPAPPRRCGDESGAPGRSSVRPSGIRAGCRQPMAKLTERRAGSARGGRLVHRVHSSAVRA